MKGPIQMEPIRNIDRDTHSSYLTESEYIWELFDDIDTEKYHTNIKMTQGMT